MKVVLDTSCISAFIRTDQIDLLLKILKGNEVMITEQVSRELKLGKIDSLHDFCSEKIKVEPADSAIAEKYNLHIGEASVISFAKTNAALAVIDDKKARAVAKKEEINFIGTATLLKLAIEKKIIERTEAKRIIGQITMDGKLFLSEETKNWILSK